MILYQTFILLLAFQYTAAGRELITLNTSKVAIDSIRQFSIREICITKHIVQIFDYSDIAFYISDDDLFEGLQRLINRVVQKLDFIAEIRTQKYQSCRQYDRCEAKHHSYVLFLESPESLLKILHYCLCNAWFNTSKFVLLIREESFVKDILIMLKQQKIYSATVVLTENPDDNEVKFWYAAGRCTDVADLKHHVFKCKSKRRQVKPYTYSESLDCPVKVGVRIQEPYAFGITGLPFFNSHGINSTFLGIEIAITNTIFGSSPIQYANTHVLKGQVNGTGLLSQLQHGEVDMLLGALPMNADTSFAMDYPHLYPKLVAVVLRRNTDLLSFLGVFKIYVWIVVLVTNLVLIFLFYIILNRNKKTVYLDTIFLYIFAILLGKSIRIEPNVRMPSMLWIWFSFFLRCAFEVLLISVLVYSEESGQVNELDELCAGSRKIFISKTYQILLRSGLHLPSCFIPFENFVVLEDRSPLDDLLETTVEERAAALMYDRHYEDSLLHLASRTDEPFHLVAETVMDVPLVFYIHPGDPMAVAVRSRSLIVQQFGWPRYYEMEADRYLLFDEVRKYGAPQMYPTLTLGQAMYIFYLYGVGVLLSCIGFVIELILCKSKRPVHKLY